jgi:putative ABC transport system permease protein
MSGKSSTAQYSVDGMPVTEADKLPVADQWAVTGSYFNAMGVQLLRGRAFDERINIQGAPEVVIISDSLARRHWPGEEAIGKRIKYGPTGGPEQWMTIVGVVADARQRALDQESKPGLYVPLRQSPIASSSLVVRTTGTPAGLASAVKEKIWAIDPLLPLGATRTMDQVVSESLWRPRIYSWLFGVFAALALGIAALGVYGVLSQSVAQRTQEIGIRMALGAEPLTVLSIIMRQGLVLTSIGLLIGLAGASVLTRLMVSLLYGVSSADLIAYSAASLILAASAAIAMLAPAYRSTRVDPIKALRCE